MNIAIIVGAGVGKRMQSKINKIFHILDEKPVIYYAIKTYQDCNFIDKIVIVTKKEDMHDIEKLKEKEGFNKIDMILEGGEKRQDSVNNGLLALHGSKAQDIVIIHNAVNPFVNKKTIADAINAAIKYDAAAVGHRAKDTVKEVDEKDFVVNTLDRRKLVQMQTPQAIKYGLAVRAYKKAYEDDFYGTDDVGLVEHLGKKVKIVESNAENIKITYPIDLSVARNLRRNSRIGFGMDSHRFVNPEAENGDKKLVLGGHVVENELGFEANSDGDIILHSLFNALSQAVGGRGLSHYADDMLEKQGIKDSKEYLKVALKLVADAEYKLNNVGIMLEGKKPRILPIEDDVKKSVALLCGIDVGMVGITATSGEDLSVFGKGKGMQCFSAITLVKK